MSRPGRSSRKGTPVPRGAKPSGTDVNGQRAARRVTSRRAQREDLHHVLELSPADQLKQLAARRSPAHPASGEPPRPGKRARKKPTPARRGEPPAIGASAAPPVLSNASIPEHEARSRTFPLRQATPPQVDAAQAQNSDPGESADVPGGVQGDSDPGLPSPETEASAPRLYTPEQAARLLQVPASWLRKRAADHAIAHTRIGRHLRFSTADLHALVHAGQHPPAAQPTDPS
ncbi:excisionase family DNA-binding protein [Streptomyces sp. NPDC051218]|uniref:excisionase family DNA-binding protein n=1 Tax=Streptomyces sp. NPDC051218 TaxID=3365645 RepID=UPI003799CB71